MENVIGVVNRAMLPSLEGNFKESGSLPKERDPKVGRGTLRLSPEGSLRGTGSRVVGVLA